MIQTSLNLTGTALRDQGIARAEDHAERESPGWSDRALGMLRQYAAEIGGRFQAEDVRAFAKARGLEDAPSARAWGGVIVRARRMGVIKFVGYENVKNKLAHATPAAVWEAV